MENQGRICPRGASYYTWRQGDTAAAIALANGVTVQALQVTNPGVDFATIAPGTEICLPSRVLTCVSGQAYTVRGGDTFTSIADQLGITVFELAERNPGIDPDRLTIGQVLCIPAATEPDINAPAAPDSPILPTPSLPSSPSTPSLPPVVVVPGCPTGYTRSSISAGETYADLLVKHNVSYRAMRAANPRLSPNFLVAGQVYCAPPHGTRETCTGLTSYTIARGETLDTLASDLGVTRGRLLSLNPNLLPSDFTAGTIICIP